MNQLTLSGSHRNPTLMPDTNPLSGSSLPQPSDSHSVLNVAKSECSSVESLADFCTSPCILPAAEKTRLVSWKFGGLLLPGQYLTANNRHKNTTKYLPGNFKTVYVAARFLSGRFKLLCGSLENPPVNGKPQPCPSLRDLPSVSLVQTNVLSLLFLAVFKYKLWTNQSTQTNQRALRPLMWAASDWK